MDYLAYGWSADEMCRQHPHWKPAEMHAAMAYYFDHQQQVDEEIHNELDEANRTRAEATRSRFSTRPHSNGLPWMAIALDMDVHAP